MRRPAQRPAPEAPSRLPCRLLQAPASDCRATPHTGPAPLREDSCLRRGIGFLLEHNGQCCDPVVRCAGFAASSSLCDPGARTQPS